jgi:hypothetical protein
VPVPISEANYFIKPFQVFKVPVLEAASCLENENGITTKKSRFF